jgi:hypothetical protein
LRFQGLVRFWLRVEIRKDFVVLVQAREDRALFLGLSRRQKGSFR